MQTTLSEPIAEALAPLFQVLPFDEAMPNLVPRGPASDEKVAVAETVVKQEAIAANPALVAGVWMYVDDLARSHAVSQTIHDIYGAYWHAIMHRREGDFSNSKYWFRQTGRLGDQAPFDAAHFIDEVSKQYRMNPTPLVQKQRQEWLWLMQVCAEKGA